MSSMMVDLKLMVYSMSQKVNKIHQRELPPLLPLSEAETEELKELLPFKTPQLLMKWFNNDLLRDRLFRYFVELQLAATKISLQRMIMQKLLEPWICYTIYIIAS